MRRAYRAAHVENQTLERLLSAYLIHALARQCLPADFTHWMLPILDATPANTSCLAGSNQPASYHNSQLICEIRIHPSAVVKLIRVPTSAIFSKSKTAFFNSACRDSLITGPARASNFTCNSSSVIGSR